MNNLKEIRDEQGCRMWELAARCGVSASTLSAIERYNYRPREATRSRIAAALGVDAIQIWPLPEKAETQ